VFQGISSEREAFDRADREVAELLIAHTSAALDRIERERELKRQNERLDRAERIIDDVLAVARGGRDPDTEPCDLREFSQRSWQAVGDAETTFETPESVDVVADPDGLLRLLENLLRNAVEHGGGHVRVRALDGDFAVEDDGDGFPGSIQDSFESGVTREGQTGLGLAICSDVADAHGWNLSLDSDGDWTSIVIGGVTVA
jgi:signal transduction histidine kinase